MTLSEKKFKALRRKLPITGVRFQFDKAAVARLAQEMSGK